MPDQDDIERLIVRSLDEALSEDEQLRLQRAIVRDPQSHRMLDDYRRIDEAAARALSEALPCGDLSFDPIELTRSCPRQSRPAYHRAWWLLPAAVAACLGWVVLIQPTFDPALTSVTKTMPALQGPQVGNRPVVGQARPTTVGGFTHSLKRHTDRELVGVLGEDGQIYWIAVDRIRTRRGIQSRPLRTSVPEGL